METELYFKEKRPKLRQGSEVPAGGGGATEEHYATAEMEAGILAAWEWKQQMSQESGDESNSYRWTLG